MQNIQKKILECIFIYSRYVRKLSFLFLPKSSSDKVKVLVTQSCLMLCDPLDSNPPGCSSIHWTFQARTLEWFAISFSKGSSQPRIESRSPELQADSLPSQPPGKPQILLYCQPMGYLLSLQLSFLYSWFQPPLPSPLIPFIKRTAYSYPFSCSISHPQNTYGLFSIHTFIKQNG